MKILFITHCNNMGGANRAMLHLILELRPLGVEAEVVLPKTKIEPQSGLKDELLHNGIPYYEDYFFFYRINSLRGFIRYVSNVVWYPRLLWKLRSRHFDIVHSNSSFTDLGVWVGLVKRIPHVWHLREFGNWGNSHPALGKLADRLMTRNTEVGIAISQKECEYYLPLFPAGKLIVIYDGVEPRECNFSASSRKDSLYKFCIVGNLCEGKNQLMAIEAAGILSKKYRNFQLYIIGGGDDYRDKLEARIADLEIDEHVCFTGEIGNVDQVLDTMNCGLTLTRNEAFGRVTVEYMLHKLPVIVTDSGANPEIVSDGDNGFIVRQDDVYGLATAMETLIQNPAMSDSMGQNGYERAGREFTSKQNASNIKHLYDSLI